jgi:hypothetical protein
MIEYNTKCVIQGGILVLIWWASSNGHLEGPTLISAAGIFWLFYVLNANLDEKYGCGHGDLYK